MNTYSYLKKIFHKVYVVFTAITNIVLNFKITELGFKTKLLSFILVFLYLPLLSGQFIEEIGTLESIYESRARSVLNTFLRPDEYTIVISGEMERDENKIKEYREKLDVQFMPGLPIPAEPATTMASNSLHEMKSKIILNLILNTEVPSVKELLLKQVLLSKLHLDETNGDAIIISRTNLPEGDVGPNKPQVLPEFTWKTWGLILLLAFMILASIVYWVNNRKTNKSEEKKFNNEFPSWSQKNQTPEELEDKSETKKAEEEKEITKIELDDLIQLKDDILFFASQYPIISARTIGDLIENGDENCVIRSFEYISWDVSRKLFSGVSPSVWGRLGVKVRARSEKPKLEEYFTALQLLNKSLISTFLESGGQKDDLNPFEFIFKLSLDERKQLLINETAGTFAIISLYTKSSDLPMLMELAAPNIQEAIPIEMVNLDKLPESTLNGLSKRLKNNLLKIKENPIVSMDGPGLSAKILRTYSPLKETEVFQKIQNDNPENAFKIRKVILQFSDIIYIPKEYILNVLNSIEIDDIVVSLSLDAPESIESFILGILPTKKAQMIQRDIENSFKRPSLTEVANARRNLCLKIEEYLKLNRISLSELIKENSNFNSENEEGEPFFKKSA